MTLGKSLSISILICLTLSSMLLEKTHAVCDICHANNPIACHSETKYSLCINGVPTRDYITCPPGYYCTNQPHICYPKESASPSCPNENTNSRCGICDERKHVYACINETTIAFCFDNNEPDLNILSYCPEDTVCDLDNPKEFCSHRTLAEPSCTEPTEEPITTTSEPTTTTPEPTTTTTPEPTTTTPEPTTTTTPEPTTTTALETTTLSLEETAEAFCRGKGEAGPYPINGCCPCTQFILCYTRNGLWRGMIRSCEINTYFYDDLAACFSIPPECT